MSYLNKKVGEIAKKDLENLKKPLGVKGRPYPMRKGTNFEHSNGDQSFGFQLGLIEDNQNPLLVYSEKSYAEVVGDAMRNMPTPSMLPLFFDALSRRAPGTPRTIQFLKGTAGAGKTFMSELIGKMRDPRGPIKIDCGQKNLSELLFETVLDFNQGKKFYDELDKKLAQKLVNPLTIKLLKENLGAAVSENEDGVTIIDWGKIGHENLIDQDGEPLSNEASTERALKALKEVSRLEGLDAQGGNALGMATQEGPLIQAWKEGREIILDEFNRGKKGTTSALHGVLQFLAGEIDEITVENTLKEKGENEESQKFTFSRKDQRVGFFVTLTGNAEEDGDDVDELPQSVNSRIMPQTVPVATIQDWQHRICQMLTGIPISTIYYSSEEQWSKDPDAFRAKLLEWRVLGLDAEKVEKIPTLQLKLLDRWEDTLEATEKLAKFYYTWSQLTNPDSKAYQSGDLAHILMELDETYHKETTIDFRKITAHINEALEARPSIIAANESDGFDAGDWSEPPQVETGTMEYDPSKNFGTRLKDVLLKYISETTQALGKTGLYKQLDQLAKDCGLKEPNLKEGRASKQFSIEALLNEDPYQSRNPRVQARIVRDMICDYWRGQSGKGHMPQISVNNEEILSITAVLKSLEVAKSRAPANDNDNAAKAEHENSFQILTSDPDKMGIAPFDQARIVDLASALSSESLKKYKVTPKTSALAARDDVLMSLALPEIRDHVFEKLWHGGLTASGQVSAGIDGAVDESLAIAEGSSKTQLAFTSVVTRVGEGENAKKAALHILFNRATQKGLIVGGKIKQDMKDIFNDCGITYVERCDPRAEKILQRGLNQVVSSGDVSQADKTLKKAFLMRASVPALEQDADARFRDMLLAKQTELLIPQYIVAGAAAPKNILPTPKIG
jgi:hypothetical protein